MSTPDLPRVTRVDPHSADVAHDRCTLTYTERFLRRRVLETAQGRRFLVDLDRATSVAQGQRFTLGDGTRIEAALEALLDVTGPDLGRLAWHIGNRHTPCQVDGTRLLIQRDHVIREMLTKLGADLRDVSEPFRPEGGAYGHGRTHGHAH